MRRLRRISLIALATLALCAVAAVLVVYGASAARLRRTYQVTVGPLALPSSPELIARGSHLASAATHCTGCHAGDLGGQVLLDLPPMRVSAPNLTAGAGGVGAQYSDADWVRALRHGIRPDGTALLIMPSHNFAVLSEADLAAIVAYVRSAAPVERSPDALELRLLGRLLLVLGELPIPAEQIDHSAAPPAAPAPGRTAAYGRYLATIGNCGDCHGGPLSGAPSVEPNVPPAPNLTPGGELGAWSEADFISAMRTGTTPAGRRLNTAMPWQLTGQLSDDELGAIFAYLQSLPPRAYNSADTLTDARGARAP